MQNIFDKLVSSNNSVLTEDDIKRLILLQEMDKVDIDTVDIDKLDLTHFNSQKLNQTFVGLSKVKYNDLIGLNRDDFVRIVTEELTAHED